MKADEIAIVDIEEAINFWRQLCDLKAGQVWPEPLQALIAVYGEMIWKKAEAIHQEALSFTAMQAWLKWYESTLDTPCIAICSTSQGDRVCKGCGRTFEEVSDWAHLPAVAKRAVWVRITKEGLAWRFNRYAERASDAARLLP